MTNFADAYPSPEDILSESFLAKYKDKQPNWGFNGLGLIVFYRTYSRPVLDENGNQIRTETWPEVIERCIRGAQRIGACYTVEEAERLFDHVFNLRCNFAGRSLWQLGTSLVEKFQANSLINCFYTNIEEWDDFLFVFENLMLGGGVTGSVRKEHIYQLPKVKSAVNIVHEKTKDADFIVPDSRQGWVELLSRVGQSVFQTGKPFKYSTILIRPYGEPIKGFGGTASGPQILIDGIQKIVEVCNARAGKKLRSVDALDIFNIIASIVVAGNVRRSAELALGDADDILFLRAKRWDLGSIPNWRALSNNTITADKFDYTSNEFWKGFEGNGECYGLFNLWLSQHYGRLIDGPMKDSDLYPQRKDNCEGTNPCSEISLANGEVCNLSELYLNNIESKEQLIDCATLLYKTQKAICAMTYLHEKTNKIVHKNMRIGIGVTGICQSLEKIDWLDGCYKAVRKFDKQWSKKREWPESIKISTVKPSGTLSLLAGSTPGVHPAYDQYYIRRIRMGSLDPMVNVCKNLGCHIENVVGFDGTPDPNTVIASFPCKSNGVIAKDMSAIDQLELVKRIQSVWADNAVSVTVYFKPDELPTIKEWLKANYETSLKCVSFLRHQDHGFKQAPYESITEDQYNQRMEVMKLSDIAQYIDQKHSDYTIDSMECAGGACPVR